MATLRERLLELLGELPPDDPPAQPVQAAESAAQPIVMDVADAIETIPASEPAQSPPGACPRCHTTQPLQPAGYGAGKRCQACGFQEPVSVVHGFSRADVDSGEAAEARTNFHPTGFQAALARARIRFR